MALKGGTFPSPRKAQGCPGKGLRVGGADDLLSTPRRHAARSPSTRHGAIKGTRETISARAAPWRVLRCASPLPGDCDRSAWLLATKTFCCRNRPYGRFGQQNVLVAKGHRGGRGSRLAKRSGATGEAGFGLEARLTRWQRGVWDLRPCARLFSESPQSEVGEETLDISLFCEVRAPGGSIYPQFPRTALREAGRRRREAPDEEQRGTMEARALREAHRQARRCPSSGRFAAAFFPRSGEKGFAAAQRR